MSKQYATFKLMNGDEIIAKIITMTDKEIIINEPVQIHRLISGFDTGQEGVRCSSCLLFSKNPTVTLDRRNILAYAQDLHSQTIKHYETFLTYQYNNQRLLEAKDDVATHELALTKKEVQKKMNPMKMTEDELNEAIKRELRGLSDIMSERANTTIH